SDPNLSLYAPIRSAGALLGAPSSGRFAPTIQLRAARVESVNAVRDAASEWLSRRYARWQERVHVAVALEELKQIEEAFLILKVFVGTLRIRNASSICLSSS